MNKKEAIKDARLKRDLFPNIGKLFLLRDQRGYFTVSEDYYKKNEFMKEYKILKIL